MAPPTTDWSCCRNRKGTSLQKIAGSCPFTGMKLHGAGDAREDVDRFRGAVVIRWTRRGRTTFVVGSIGIPLQTDGLLVHAFGLLEGVVCVHDAPRPGKLAKRDQF